ncbi:MAG: bifunctional hydroxymethylpyrimidine kinase/phosphomethylpyrimidine kinase [Selenomonadaceae bacterium]|nr:bifunctional hydroxymethylpyrimidine kinase/phosphomethylpyrimidine kinase [Selenomonadaceae bacterium]
MKTALTIAGSDSSGGAGIQADIKTMLAQGVFAMSAITALTAQNTMGVKAISEVTPDFLAAQIDCVFEDIPPDAVKVGMVFSAELIGVVADRMRRYRVENLVVDPVMVATSGAKLLNDNAIKALEEELLPLAKVITPNLPEAAALAKREIKNKEDMAAVARLLADRYGVAVLCKGGHCGEDAEDLLYADGKLISFFGERVASPNTHGTGCTLSSAIAARLALGQNLEEAVRRAKDYVTGALKAGLNLGKGSGPLDHGYNLIIKGGDLHGRKKADLG